MREVTTVIPMSSKTSPSTLRAPIRIGTALSNEFQRLTVDGLRAVGFWAAVVLPVAYLPAAYGVMGFESAWSRIALVALHIACVVIGHEHNAPAASEER